MTTMATSTKISAYSTSLYAFSLPVLMNTALKTFCPERATSVAPHTAKKTATRPEAESAADSISSLGSALGAHYVSRCKKASISELTSAGASFCTQ